MESFALKRHMLLSGDLDASGELGRVAIGLAAASEPRQRYDPAARLVRIAPQLMPLPGYHMPDSLQPTCVGAPASLTLLLR